MLKFASLFVLFIISVGTGFAASKKPAGPAWMQARIEAIKKGYQDPKTDQVVSIEKYNFKGKTYFLMPPAAPCCDMPTELVDESGKTFCQLGGGFTGHTDPQCANFKEAAKLLETVWTSTAGKKN